MFRGNNSKAVNYGSVESAPLPQETSQTTVQVDTASWSSANKAQNDAPVDAWIKKAFSLFDPESKGYVDSVDFAEDIQHMFPNSKEEDIEELLEDADPRGVGIVTFDNFCKAMNERLKGKVPLEALEEGFKAFDRDGDGYINAQDLVSHVSTFIRERETEDDGESSRGRSGRESSFSRGVRDRQRSSHSATEKSRGRNTSPESSTRSVSPELEKYEHEAEKLIAKKDMDHDGRINLKEFVDAASEQDDNSNNNDTDERTEACSSDA
eukprot:jgi/Galph1/2494/GphlegSOOS_G1143.1